MDDANRQQVLTAELLKLSALLRQATDGFQAGNSEMRRPAVRIALGGLSEFVGNVFALDQELRLPLNHLLYGLHDLDHGQSGSLLKRTKVRHRSKGPLSVRLFHAMAAALMDVYQQAKPPRESAAIRAAHKLNELGYRDEKGQHIAAKSVNRWRNELNAVRGKGDLAADRYKYLKKMLKSKYPDRPEKAAQFLLDVLPGIATRTIPRKPIC
jgi:hypothetical protein